MDCYFCSNCCFVSCRNQTTLQNHLTICLHNHPDYCFGNDKIFVTSLSETKVESRFTKLRLARTFFGNAATEVLKGLVTCVFFKQLPCFLKIECLFTSENSVLCLIVSLYNHLSMSPNVCTEGEFKIHFRMLTCLL